MRFDHALIRAAGIGVVAGLRSMTAPAAVARRADALHWRRARNVVTALAVGELIAGKLPFVPRRTSRGPLIARLVSGAVCGAVVGCSPAGAPAGALGALAGAFLGYQARRRAARFGLVAAVVEDAVAIAGARLALSVS
jgi:uncharacterized membrane protein